MKMEKFEENAFLLGNSGSLSGRRWEVKAQLIVGREQGCDVVIGDRQVSRQHAKFTQTPQGITVEDLGSKNGTHLNGKPIDRPILLKDGDVIQIALAEQLIFISSDATLPLELPEAEVDQHRVYGTSAGEAQSVRTRLRLDDLSRTVWITPTSKTSKHPSPPAEIELDPPLSAYQYALLKKLYDQRDQVISRSDLITSVWGEEEAIGISEQAFDALVRRLRDRLKSIDPAHEYILTVRGHGLRLDNPPLPD
jgi:pSer/pThr/pTyr-binding forkhead associated (FHA) protein